MHPFPAVQARIFVRWVLRVHASTPVRIVLVPDGGERLSQMPHLPISRGRHDAALCVMSLDVASIFVCQSIGLPVVLREIKARVIQSNRFGQ